jgi:RNA 3'-terminal phosphate cyclase-like protein
LQLLDEVLYSGSIDTTIQSTVLTMMALSEKKISKIKLGRVSSYTIENLRLLKEFFGVTFQIEQEKAAEEEKEEQSESQEEFLLDKSDDGEQSVQQEKEIES